MKTAIHGLPASVIKQINGVLSTVPELERAVLFGSRAKGSAKPGSDIDLALQGDGLNWRIVGKIYDALDDLLLPYEFSLIQYDAPTAPEVANHIDRVGITLYQRHLIPASSRG